MAEAVRMVGVLVLVLVMAAVAAVVAAERSESLGFAVARRRCEDWWRRRLCRRNR